MITWEKLAERIAEMPEEERQKSAKVQDDGTGERLDIISVVDEEGDDIFMTAE